MSESANGSNAKAAVGLRNCSSPLDNIDLEDPRVLGSLVPLGIICLVVIFGNIMVILAVRMTHKLRGATNIFIVSLAWADLMLGIVVLPFSAMYEVFSIWIFGPVWCSIWLAVDVWMCTASILHLVVISMDRYIAVTHPITYPNLMTTKRAKLLILGAWILSFVICFPPLVGWNEQANADFVPGGARANLSMVSDEDISALMQRCLPQCKLNQEPGYVIYSAVGSFYAPMLVMMFFNWRIYRTATKTTKAIRQGWTKVKGVSGESADGLVSMGIHRGGGVTRVPSRTSSTNYSMRQPPSSLAGPVGPAARAGAGAITPADTSDTSPYSSRTLPLPKQSVSNGRVNSRRSPSSFRHRSGEACEDAEASSMLLVSRMAQSVSSSCLAAPTSASSTQPRPCVLALRPQLSQHQPCPNHVAGKTFSDAGTQTNSNNRVASPCSVQEGVAARRHARRWPSWPHFTRWRRIVLTAKANNNKTPSALRAANQTEFLVTAPSLATAAAESTETSRGGVSSTPTPTQKLGKRNIKSQVRRFRMETKAAKTLGIIVGCFICCWFPFFTMYLITAFCETCFPPLAFSVIFWLGYCNSAINPFIYAMFSRDFRGAFKRILCRFLCQRTLPPEGGALVRMGLPFAPHAVAIGLTDRLSHMGNVSVATGVVAHSTSAAALTSPAVAPVRRASLMP
jgi:octopamine receptor